jgi:hypothetical protein
MLPIKINVDELVQEFNLSSKDVSDLKEELLSGLCNELYRWWTKEAREKLHSSRNEYMRSLKVFREGQFKGGVMLIGQLPNMIENGISAFDMKVGMLKSGKVKFGKNGQSYITVPFRIGTPEAIGEAFSGIMDQATYAVAKALQGKQQVKQSQLTGQVAIPQTRAFTKNQTQVFEAYTHKSSTMAGITKGQGQFHGTYTSFRRISSSASDSNSWIHSGITAYKLADKALNDMNVTLLVDKTLDDFLSQKFG